MSRKHKLGESKNKNFSNLNLITRHRCMGGLVSELARVFKNNKFNEALQ